MIDHSDSRASSGDMQKSGRLTGSETPLNDVGIVLGTTFSRLVAGQVTRLHRLLAAGFHRFLSPLYPPDALRTPLYPFVFVSLSARIHFTYISHPLREHFRERENLESRWNHKKTASIRSIHVNRLEGKWKNGDEERTFRVLKWKRAMFCRVSGRGFASSRREETEPGHAS